MSFSALNFEDISPIVSLPDFDYSVSELKVLSRKDIIKSSLKKRLHEWNQLDMSVTTIKDTFDLYNNGDSLGKVPKHQGSDYITSLSQIVNKMPRIVDIENKDNDPSLHSAKWKTHPDDELDRWVAAKCPELLVENFSYPHRNNSHVPSSSSTKIHNEVMLSFATYSPIDDSCHQMVDVLGSQSLVDLKDALYCVNDTVKPIIDIGADARYKNDNFMYIEGVFYVDTRHLAYLSDQTAAATTTAAGLRHWLRRSIISAQKSADREDRKAAKVGTNRQQAMGATNGGIVVDQDCNAQDHTDKTVEDGQHTTMEATTTGPKRQSFEQLLGKFMSDIHYMSADELQFPVRSMQDTRCDSVFPLKLASRYLYSHSCGCEHLLYLTDIRIEKCGSSSSSHQNSRGGEVYPCTVYKKTHKRRRCGVCDVNSAAFLTYGDRMADSSPAFFCKQCYHMLHYTDDGSSLIYPDFRVFPYLHDT